MTNLYEGQEEKTTFQIIGFIQAAFQLLVIFETLFRPVCRHLERFALNFATMAWSHYDHLNRYFAKKEADQVFHLTGQYHWTFCLQDGRDERI